MARQKSDDGRHMKGWTLCQKKTLLSHSPSLSKPEESFNAEAFQKYSAPKSP